jgi:hypothetical protein
MLTRNTDPQLVSQLALEPPAILALHAAAAAAPDADRSQTEAALTDAIAAHREHVLDLVRDRIVVNVERIEAALFSPEVEAANEELRFLVEFLILNFSVTQSSVSKNPIPHGMLLDAAVKARGPLLGLARTFLDLVPVRSQIKFSHDLDSVKAARAAQRGAR